MKRRNFDQVRQEGENAYKVRLALAHNSTKQSKSSLVDASLKALPLPVKKKTIFQKLKDLMKWR